MQEITAGKNEDGQRLERVIEHFLCSAGKGFIFKMLRKKNITLNGKKAEGNEKLVIGDKITFWLSDDTIEAFQKGNGGTGAKATGDISEKEAAGKNAAKKAVTEKTAGKAAVKDRKFDFSAAVIYEDEDIILVNKPAGILTQQAVATDVSLNEYLISYLLDTQKVSEASLRTFRPSVCNRLDRNTSGIVACGVSLKGSRVLSEYFRERTAEKYYMCIVQGNVTEKVRLDGYIKKDHSENKVTVYKEDQGDCERVITEYRPVKHTAEGTLLEVKLITGKTHQIRAHLASAGHPLAGDPKYGNEAFNRLMRDKYRIGYQVLCAYRLVFPKNSGLSPELDGKEFVIGLPDCFKRAGFD